MKRNMRKFTSMALAVAMLASPVLSNVNAMSVFASDDSVQISTDVMDSSEVSVETPVTLDEPETDAIDVQSVSKVQASVSVKDADIVVDDTDALYAGDSVSLHVDASNQLDADTSLKLYFWNYSGDLSEDKDEWSSVLTDPAVDLFFTDLDDDSKLPVSVQTADGEFVSGTAQLKRDSDQNDAVTARYLDVVVPAGGIVDFDVTVSSASPLDLVVVPIMMENEETVLFDAASISWIEQEITVETEPATDTTEEIVIDTEENTESVVIEPESETESESETETDAIDISEPETAEEVTEAPTETDSTEDITIETEDTEIEETELETTVPSESETNEIDIVVPDETESETTVDIEEPVTETEEVGIESEVPVTEEETEEVPATEEETESASYFMEPVEGTEELNESDFASMRLVVLTSNPDAILDQANVIANYDSIYLLQYESVQQAMNAYMYYQTVAEAVEPDAVLETASDGSSGSEVLPEVTEEENPIAALSVEGDSPAVQTTNERVIALIDTGAQLGTNVIDQVSLIDDVMYGNGHGDEMVSAIVSQNPNAKILSIRAMGDDGKGTVSAVVAGIEYAIAQNVDIINLSLYAKTNLLNSVLEAEIQKAVAAGIEVVGAAGNDGEDAAGYMPGSVAVAWIIGSCNLNGVRVTESNYGGTVDYYVVGRTTSESAAKFTGYISANGTDNISAEDLIFSDAMESEDEVVDGGSYNLTSKFNTDGGYVDIRVDDGYFDSFYPTDEEGFSVPVEPDQHLYFDLYAYAGYGIESYVLRNTDTGDVIMEGSDLVDEDRYDFMIEWTSDCNMQLEVNFVEDDSHIAVSHRWELLYVANTLVRNVGSEFDPSTYFDDLSSYVREGDQVELVYSDVNPNETGLYTTVYHVSNDTEYFAIRRPVEIVEPDSTSRNYFVTFLSDVSNGMNANVERLDYNAGEEVVFAVTPADGNTISNVTGYLADEEEAENLFFGDEFEVSPTEGKSVEEFTNLENAVFMNENTQYYRFTMPEDDVYVFVSVNDGSLSVAADGDAADDELDKFTLNQTSETRWYYNSKVTPKARGTRFRTVTFKWRDDDGVSHTQTNRAYCLQPALQCPFNGATQDFRASQGSVVALSDGGVVSKGLYYLYKGPGWNKDIEDSDGNVVNMKDILDKYAPQSGGGNPSGNTGEKGYYALTHFILGYCYSRTSERLWNYEDDGKSGEVWNARGKKWLEEIRQQLIKMPKPTVMLRHGRDDMTSGTIDKSELLTMSNGKLRTYTLRYYTYVDNIAVVTLPSGVSMIVDDLGNREQTGRVTLKGGQAFWLIFDLNTYTKKTYDFTLRTKYAVNYEGWKIKTGAGLQDVGFAYFTGEKTIGLDVELPEQSRIQIKKTTANGGWNDALKGAQFTLYEGSSALATVTINSSAYHTFNYDCQIGHTYTIRETKTPSGFVTASPITCAINSSNYKATYSYSIANIQQVKLQITKQSSAPSDILNLSSYSVQGAQFGIYTNSACTNKIGTLTSGADGKTSTFTLPCTSAGNYTYYVREDVAPAGHKRNTTPVSVSVSLPANGGTTKQVTIKNDPEFPTVSALVEKLDNKGWPVIGAQFQVRFYDSTWADTGKLMKTWVLQSDDRGYVYMDDTHKISGPDFYRFNGQIVIPKGYLTIQEIKAPAQYIMDTTIYNWNTTGQTLTMRRIANDLHPCQIRLKKFDANGTSPLANVEFELTFVKASETLKSEVKPYRPLLKEGQSVTYKTNSAGEVTFSNLDQGQYKITEVKTVEGHTLLKEPIVVTLPITMTTAEAAANGADTSQGTPDSGYSNKWFFYDCLYEVTNDYNFTMPSAGSTGTWTFGYIGLGVVAVVGVGVLIYTRRKGRKRPVS